MSEKTKIKLKHPFTFDGMQIEEIEIRRPKGRDLKEMAGKAQSEQDFFLLARVTEKPAELFDEMDGADVMTCMEEMRGFLSLGR